MAENTYRDDIDDDYDNDTQPKQKPSQLKKTLSKFFNDRRLHLAWGVFLFFATIYLFIAFVSYVFTAEVDQSVVEAYDTTGVREGGEQVDNWLGMYGALLSYFFIYKWFGLGAFLIVPLSFIYGWYWVFKAKLMDTKKYLIVSTFFVIWISVTLSYVFSTLPKDHFLGLLVGGIGFEVTNFLNAILGWGTILFIVFALLVFIIYFFNITKVKSPNINIDSSFKEKILAKFKPFPKPKENTPPPPNQTFSAKELAQQEDQELQEESTKPAINESLEQIDKQVEEMGITVINLETNEVSKPEKISDPLEKSLIDEQAELIKPIKLTLDDITGHTHDNEISIEEEDKKLKTTEPDPENDVLKEADLPNTAEEEDTPEPIPEPIEEVKESIPQPIEEEEDLIEKDPDLIEEEALDPIEEEIKEPTPDHINSAQFHDLESNPNEDIDSVKEKTEEEIVEKTIDLPKLREIELSVDNIDDDVDKNIDNEKNTTSIELSINQPEETPQIPEKDSEPEKEVEKTVEEVLSSEPYDPRLDLPDYQFPTIDLLNIPKIAKIQINTEELEANKEKIVETLGHYKIRISSIKATVGPTCTLYEIVPDAGIRISKIKNLEDDIALSLAALGIRIIAPMPGKGTIGIEVPNKNRELVAMHTLVSHEAFINEDKMHLPVVFGKTITNEYFMADLAKMPHLLMAGATGQGKSVGLNVLLTSLLYKKHPAELKFVLVDPKKVELSLFSKIERHFLAKLPNEEEAIITDTSKVINTLNSLCVEMDTRYDLLKDAFCKNIEEYNKKFLDRKLSPKKKHHFLPYIVLVIDELADLMMTAGKEVEQPIARLAQLARAIGIHLVVATQRPSVNVITGIIKANFPARLSFRVTSKIDSRTILDAGGAEQLIGKGDMLYSSGSDMMRIQCAFVDTPEVERICEFIGGQRGYPEAFSLPEYISDLSEDKPTKADMSKRDALFEEAARLVVRHQQGSTSLIQRRLSVGYSRAGKLIDQLEQAGIVGQFVGSKARDVLVPDEYSLEQLLNEILK